MISAPTPEKGKPSSTVTNLPVFLTLFIIQSLSKGLIVLRLMTYAEIPCFYNSAAAYMENLTFLEYPTIVKSVPSLIILAFPIGIVNYLSKTDSDTVNYYPYKFSFSKKITGS